MSAASKTRAQLKLSGQPKPGEAIRAVLVGQLNVTGAQSNDDLTLEFQWFRRRRMNDNNSQGKEGEEEEEEEIIEGCTAPIYLIRKQDLDHKIGAVAMLRSKKDDNRHVLATFRAEMDTSVFMDDDDFGLLEDEDDDDYGNMHGAKFVGRRQQIAQASKKKKNKETLAFLEQQQQQQQQKNK